MTGPEYLTCPRCLTTTLFRVTADGRVQCGHPDCAVMISRLPGPAVQLWRSVAEGASVVAQLRRHLIGAPYACQVCLDTGEVESIDLDGESAYTTACPECARGVRPPH